MIRHSAAAEARWTRASRAARCWPALLAILAFAGCIERAPELYGVEDGQWRSYAGDPGSSRYSPLDQIDADNFGRIAVAWRWTSADVDWKKRLSPSSRMRTIVIHFIQSTPLMVDGTLYGVTQIGQVFALDGATGREIWVHDPSAHGRRWKDRVWPMPRHRGVTYWRSGDDERIFLPTHDAWLLALDARSGEPVRSFGDDGRVDLLAGLRYEGPIERQRDYKQTSPAALFRDTLIVGGAVGDRPSNKRGIPGDVRAYDARTGKLEWTFHTVPAEGEFGTETWEGDSWRYSGAANAWGPISVDLELGVVFVVTSTPTSDFYGGHRLGDNLFAESLVALDAESGERLWHFQLVRHGLWDYDPAAPANLVEIEVDGRRVRAVAQVTKQAHTFVFDRVSGEPIWPIEDRRVPASDVPGERASATQPFPSRPPPFDRQGTFESDLIDFTPELHAQALEIFRRYRTGPMFTPPSLRGTLSLPSAAGGASWMGAGVDPESGTLFVPSITRAAVFSVVPADSTKTDIAFERGPSGGVSLPEGSHWLMGGVPIFKPPYSRITAIDLNRGEIRWQVPNGDGPRGHPLLKHLDLPPMGSGGHTCVLVTRRLVLAPDGGTSPWAPNGQPILRAFDKDTGEIVGEAMIPAPARGCPMTYSIRGTQFIVVAVGAPDHDPEFVALALPERIRSR